MDKLPQKITPFSTKNPYLAYFKNIWYNKSMKTTAENNYNTSKNRLSDLLPFMTFIDKNDLLKRLNTRMFWDTQIEKLDYEKNMKFIIERIAEYGNENDEMIMYAMYTKNQIINSLKLSDNLIEKTVLYYSYILNIKKEDFKCYSKILARRKQ
jgi:hypothetical protein